MGSGRQDHPAVAAPPDRARRRRADVRAGGGACRADDRLPHADGQPDVGGDADRGGDRGYLHPDARRRSRPAGRRGGDLRRGPRTQPRRRPRAGAAARGARGVAARPAAGADVGDARRRGVRGADPRAGADRERGPDVPGRTAPRRARRRRPDRRCRRRRRPRRARRRGGIDPRLPARRGRDRAHRRAPCG